MAAIFPGCSSSREHDAPLTIVSVGDLGDAVAGARTFAIMPEGRVARPLPDRDPRALAAAVDDALSRTLQDKGFAMAEAASASRLIAYVAGVAGSVENPEVRKIFGVQPGMDFGSEYPRGMVALAIVHRGNRRVLWRGSVSAEIDPRMTIKERDQGIRRGIELLLRDLPEATSR